MRSALRLACLSLLLLAGACIELATPDPREGDELPAILETQADTPRVTAPASVRAGQFAQLEVTTFGDACTEFGRTAVSTAGSTADVRPYDRYRTGTGCPGAQRLIRHPVQLRFDDVGTATVRIHGRRMPGDVDITVTRTITITPP